MSNYENFKKEYHEKLVTAKEAVKVVKSGDYLSYGGFALFTDELDIALADRADELEGVIVRTMCSVKLPEIVKRDAKREHFIWLDSHYSGIGRSMHDKQIINYIPSTYHQWPKQNEQYGEYDVIFVKASPMDKHGYFNIGLSNSETISAIMKSKKVFVEVNSNVPVCYGGYNESIHISQVDLVVESNNEKLAQIPNKAASAEEAEIARLIVNQIEDGSCIQLGIGALPNMAGSLIAKSNLKNLGVHTEMMVDAYVEMYEAGKITGTNKKIDQGKMVYTFGLGTDKLYEFLDHNSVCASYPADYTNNPAVIARNDKVISINNAIEVDLFSQVSSETAGTTQISGTGGQLDYVMGAFNSTGGKSFICLTSTFKDKLGKVHSRIRPAFDTGTNITVPRSLVNYVVTEYGIAQLKGKSTWERAEALINISHPDFREELTKEAEKLHIWNYNSK